LQARDNAAVYRKHAPTQAWLRLQSLTSWIEFLAGDRGGETLIAEGLHAARPGFVTRKQVTSPFWGYGAEIAGFIYNSYHITTIKKKILQEKAVEATKQKKEKRKTPKPEEKEGMPQRQQHCISVQLPDRDGTFAYLFSEI
jgi:hypothetical protein